MIKVLAACGCGMGSSQLIKMNLKNALKKIGIQAEVTHTSISEAKSMASNFDLIVVGENFVSSFKEKDIPRVVGLKNLLDKKELEEKLKEFDFTL